jgi:hypothetical protein
MGLFRYIKDSLKIWVMNSVGTIIVFSTIFVVLWVIFTLRIRGGL